MQIDSLALQMRPRAPHEAADLGVRLCQASAREVYACYLAVAIPVSLLAMSLFEIGPWWPVFALWCAKPWLDRTVLYVLSRAAFGQRTRVRDLWADQRHVWWSQFILTWTWRRLSPWRSFTQPIYQLEGSKVGLRRRQLGRRYRGPALAVTAMFSLVETFLVLALMGVVSWLVPSEQGSEQVWQQLDDLREFAAVYLPMLYGAVILLLEPFYVAAGFAMYLNRRTELEAWDVEQELRRAFAS